MYREDYAEMKIANITSVTFRNCSERRLCSLINVLSTCEKNKRELLFSKEERNCPTEVYIHMARFEMYTQSLVFKNRRGPAGFLAGRRQATYPGQKSWQE